MRKNFNKIVALSMSVFMVGSMIPAMNVKADDAPATVKTVNSDFINGDFEKGIEPWQIQKNSDAFEVVEEGEGHALKVSAASSEAEIRNTAWFTEPSTEYVISYETKLEGEGSVSISKHEFTAAWDYAIDSISNLAKVTSTGDGFTKASYKFTTNANTAFVQIDLKVKGNALIDNVTITKVEPAVAEVDFSNTDGWTGVSASEKIGTKPVDVFDFNNGFENGSGLDTSSGHTKNVEVIEFSNAHGGSKVLECYDSTNTQTYAFFNLTGLNLKGNTQYYLRYYVYIPNEAKIPTFQQNITVAKSPWTETYKKWQVASEITATSEKSKWIEVNYEFKCDGDSDILQLALYANGETKYYVDDVQIFTKEDVDVYSDGVGAFGKDGDAALKLESTDKVSYEASKLVEGTTYEYSYDVKVEDAGEGFEFSTSLDDKKVTANTDWTTVTGTFVAGEGKNIELNRAGTGVVYFDNLTVKELVNIHVHHGAATTYDVTCTEDGKVVYNCSDCNGVVYTEYKEKAKGHSFKIKVKTVDATYTDKGYTVYKCEHCDATENRDWKDVKAPETTTKAPETTKLKAPSQVKSVKLTAKKKSLKVTWKKVTGVKKYQVQLCTSKKFKKGVIKKNASKNSLTVKKLKAKKKYYVRVRAVKTSGKQTAYGKWSKAANKKTK